MSWKSTHKELIEGLKRLEREPSLFETLALKLFRYQSMHNPVYREFVNLLGVSISQVNSLSEIPPLPIQAFKQQEIKTGDWEAETIFHTSGTGGQVPGKHFIRDIKFYRKHSYSLFKKEFGDQFLQESCLLALLPSYIERGHSSLVTMVDHLIQKTDHQKSGFYLHDYQHVLQWIRQNEEESVHTILFGVGFALMDLVDLGPFDFQNLTIIETGGMKNRRREIPKTIMLQQLRSSFPKARISSEYGMTELMSQAYRVEGEYFSPAFSMRLITREISDPLSVNPSGSPGILQIIDLANIDSCAFLLTEDVGTVLPDGRFTVEGRLDISDIRGCQLMLAEI